jgi:hypothetical protein
MVMAIVNTQLAKHAIGLAIRLETVDLHVEWFAGMSRR